MHARTRAHSHDNIPQREGADDQTTTFWFTHCVTGRLFVARRVTVPELLFAARGRPPGQDTGRRDAEVRCILQIRVRCGKVFLFNHADDAALHALQELFAQICANAHRARLAAGHWRHACRTGHKSAPRTLTSPVSLMRRIAFARSAFKRLIGGAPLHCPWVRSLNRMEESKVLRLSDASGAACCIYLVHPFPVARVHVRRDL